MATISGLSATSLAPGASLTITGTEFGATQGASMVFLDQFPCTVTAWGDTSITVNIPNNADSGSLYLKLQQEIDGGIITVTNAPVATC